MRQFATHRILIVVLLAALIALGGCSRIQIVYRSADFLLAGYVDDYLGLDSRQLEAWEPRLKSALAEHRAQELPRLAGFFDQTLKASREGFDTRATSCLTSAFKDLYRDHARLAAELTAPLLAGLDQEQISALDRRFQAEYEDDRTKPGTDPSHERRKRTRRYAQAIEDWTGPLTDPQRELAAEIAGNMPDTAESVLAYRMRKREQLIALLRSGVGEADLRAYLTDWLVEYRDLPPDLSRAGNEIEARVLELFTRLWPALDSAQRERVQSRVTALRDDLLALQKKPRLAPLRC